MTTALEGASIVDQVDAVRRGDIVPGGLVLATRRRIDADEPELRAWVVLADDLEQQAAASASARPEGPLLGISVGVKDLIDVAGLPTRAGSVTTSDAPRSADAACVARLRNLGAVVQGKTVTTEFGYFAPGPTRNPHSPNHTPGGSSSGSSAAVGAGTVPVALGTQTAGSLTRPASYCGAAGLVLSQGSTSLLGITGLSESLDSLGMLTRTSADLSHVYAAFRGPSAVSSPPTTRAMFWCGSDLAEIDPAMRSLLHRTRGLVAELGIAADDLDWDDHVRTLADDHVTVMAHEAANTLRSVYSHECARLSEPLRALVVAGTAVTEDRRDAALVRRDLSSALFCGFMGSDAIVVGPAATGPAPLGLGATGSPILSRPWQLLGVPVVVVPGARTEHGLPLGVQLLGVPGSESALLDVAVRLEPLLRDLPPFPTTEQERRR